MDGLLVLSNGRVFRGQLRGAQRPTAGEVIFNTSMSGYQEILTDPSYAGQIVTMTYPHIGNYGTNPEDVESRAPSVRGFIVKELSPVTSNWRSTESLDDYLSRHGITVLEGIDTRALVISLREQGTVPGMIAPAEAVDEARLRAEATALPSMVGQNLARTVSVPEPYDWATVEAPPEPVPTRFRVIAYDYGIKFNILRCLAARGAQVEVVPYDYPAAKVLERKPDGVFLSNGPGDPEPVTAAVENVKALLGQVPIFGICLGHQILGLALGAKSYKLKFGHHGANHPVMHLDTGKIEVTSQNHGFAVAEDSLPSTVRVTHRSLNDQTVEGFESLVHPAYSVQYHPEASPGPHDSLYLFDRFVQMMERDTRHSA
ncbi:MAG TPA: glutamine-hydrolyzing carbamoyl-phosphate synthase small subunit [bacterium]|nr:glutamine-hydrolyzing carbamoyl-phosphate synthase small subunit [bacterium]